MEITIQQIKPDEINDFIQLIRVFEQVFEMENLVIPDKDDLLKTLNQPSFIAVTVKNERGDIIGGLTGYKMLQYYDTRPLMYLYDIGIKEEFRNKGIGKKLISWFIQYGKENNYAEIFVEAEADDLDACGFYRSTPASGEIAVSHFYYKF